MNSGPVVISSIGDDVHMEYAAIGDTTNLTARMQSLAEPGSILVSNNTYKLVREFFQFDYLGTQRIKGKDEPLDVYRLMETSEIKTKIKAAAVKGLSGFVGREPELKQLLNIFEKVRSGYRRTMQRTSEEVNTSIS